MSDETPTGEAPDAPTPPPGRYKMAELAHPGTVPVHDAGALESGERFYAMERVHGQTLSQILGSRDPTDLFDRGALLGLVDIFERVCQTAPSTMSGNSMAQGSAMS